MIPRLEDLCGVQGAIVHANKLEVKETLSSGFSEMSATFQDNTVHWFKFMEEKVSTTLKGFNGVLREKISTSVIIWSSFESYQWAKFHEEKFGLSFNYCYYLLRSSFFTSKGAIDKEKAARVILKDTEISSSLRFCIACYYCFFDVIPALWDQLPEYKRPKVIKGKIKTEGLGKGGNDVMVSEWSRFLLGELDGINSFSYYIFKKCFEMKVSCMERSYPGPRLFQMNCNSIAFKNCFVELNESQRRKAVIFSREKLRKLLSSEITYFCPENPQQFFTFTPHIESVIYLLRHLDENEIKVLFQEEKTLFLVLYQMLNWPYQHLLISTVNRVRELRNWEFLMLICKILDLISHELPRKFYDFSHIFKELWRKGSSHMKRFFFQVQNGYFDYSDVEDDEDFKCFPHEIFYDDEIGKYFKIDDLFQSLSFAPENEEIIQLIFSSATMEEKRQIAENKRVLRYISHEVCDLNKVKLFIECCVPKAETGGFKRNFFDFEKRREHCWNIIINGNLELLQELLNWKMNNEEIEEYLKNLLNLFLKSVWDILKYSLNQLKYVDKFLERVLSSDEAKVFKENLVVNADRLAFYYHSFQYSLKGDFQKIETYLKWIGLSQKDYKDFKRQFAFQDNIIKYYSECISQRQLSRTDEFLYWTEITETEVKEFKKRLMFNKRIVSLECASLILERNYGFVKELLNWTQLSKEEEKDFYFILLEDFIYRKSCLVGKKGFFGYSPSPLWEFERKEKNFGFRITDIIEYFVMKDEWDEVEETLSLHFSSKKEIEEFKKKFPLETSWLYLRLISEKRFDDVDKFFAWTGIDDITKNSVLEHVLFNSRIYEIVATVFVGREIEIERLLNWMCSNDILLMKWKESFLNWFNETKVEGTCFYSNCVSQTNVRSSFCSSCKRYTPSSKYISEFIRLVDEEVRKSKGKRKRTPESCHEVTTRSSKENRRC